VLKYLFPSLLSGPATAELAWCIVSNFSSFFSRIDRAQLVFSSPLSVFSYSKVTINKLMSRVTAFVVFSKTSQTKEHEKKKIFFFLFYIVDEEHKNAY
jgi:hypothetical protein